MSLPGSSGQSISFFNLRKLDRPHEAGDDMALKLEFYHHHERLVFTTSNLPDF
jgi:hypothetical protein